MKSYCDACGEEAADLVFIEVRRTRLESGSDKRTVVAFSLCLRCSSRLGRTLARDTEQKERVARALTDEGRQVRKEEAWERRKALRAELASG